MSRDAILNRIKENKSSEIIDLPDLAKGIHYEDLLLTFSENIKLVGGEVLSEGNVESYITALEEKHGAMKFMNTYLSSEFKNPLIPIQMKNPHDAERLDLLVVEGSYGVAENGAIWVSEPDLYPRSALFLAQHLIIYLKASTVFNNLHGFYEKVDLKNNCFGTLISGPSKTADVEQCLVIGAHGPRSLGVVLV